MRRREKASRIGQILDELYPFVKKDMKATLEIMGERPVTFRLLDPPLHEFVPQSAEERTKLAAALTIDAAELDRQAEELHEMNPMMGHRGVRLGVTFPEISEMQFRAILESAAELSAEGKPCFPEIMDPVTCAKAELDDQRALADLLGSVLGIGALALLPIYLWETTYRQPPALSLSRIISASGDLITRGSVWDWWL